MTNSTGFHGPLALICDIIDDEVVEDCPGAYTLGFTDQNGNFRVTYVGSAGSNLRQALRGHIGTATEFKFRHFADQKAAFEKQCELFHDFMPGGYSLHPQRPPASDWRCPRCRRGS